MWGEFEDESTPRAAVPPQTTSRLQQNEANTTTSTLQQNKANTATSGQVKNSDDDYSFDDLELPVRERLLKHVAASDVTVKSQQRYEPDLTYQERKDILTKLLDDKPAQFLYRFGRVLRRDHLQYFLKHEGEPDVDHYLAITQQHLNTHTAKIRVRNRRYAAIQRLRREGDYFSEKEMERRKPLLYDQLIAQYQTQQEQQQSHSSMDSTQLSFSSILLEHFDLRAHKELKRQQEEAEDDMLEEEDDDSDQEEEDREEERGGREPGERRLYREEFYSASYADFLGGSHQDYDYGQVDTNEEYDLLDIEARDREESYFDHDSDDPPDISPHNYNDEMTRDPSTPSPTVTLLNKMTRKQVGDDSSATVDKGAHGTEGEETDQKISIDLQEKMAIIDNVDGIMVTDAQVNVKLREEIIDQDENNPDDVMEVS